MKRTIGRTIAAAACAALLATSAAHAQPYGTDLISGDAGGRLWRTSLTGAASVMFDAALPTHGVCLHHDNQSICFTQSTLSTVTPSGLYRYDPNTSQVTTLYSSTSYIPYDVVQNADGDLVFTGFHQSGATLETGVFKLSGGVVSTVVTTVQLGVSLSQLNSGISINGETGNYLVVAGAYPDIGAQYVWDISDQGGITTLGSTGNSRYSHAQDKRTGDVYISGYQTIYVLQKNQSVHTTAIGGPSNFYAIVADRVSDPTTGLVARTANKILTVDVQNDVVVSITTSLSGSTTYETKFDRSRNIATEKTGPATWNIKFDFPGEGGYAYQMALGVSGPRSPTTVPGGRRIYLFFDDLSVLSLAGALPGIFNPGPGQLDANGRATATLNMSFLPRITTPIFMCAATFQPGGGFGTITDPYVAKFVK